MTPILSTFKTAGRAVLVAATLGGALLAAPAMAAPPAHPAQPPVMAPQPAPPGQPSLSFNLGIGANGQPSFGFNVHAGNGPAFRFGPGPFVCLSDRQVVNGLRDLGFRSVSITDSSRRRAEAEGEKGRYEYEFAVNKCSGEVDITDRTRIRHSDNSYDDNGHGHQNGFDDSSFGMSFQNGNGGMYVQY